MTQEIFVIDDQDERIELTEQEINEQYKTVANQLKAVINMNDDIDIAEVNNKLQQEICEFHFKIGENQPDKSEMNKKQPADVIELKKKINIAKIELEQYEGEEHNKQNRLILNNLSSDILNRRAQLIQNQELLTTVSDEIDHLNQEIKLYEKCKQQLKEVGDNLSAKQFNHLLITYLKQQNKVNYVAVLQKRQVHTDYVEKSNSETKSFIQKHKINQEAEKQINSFVKSLLFCSQADGQLYQFIIEHIKKITQIKAIINVKNLNIDEFEIVQKISRIFIQTQFLNNNKQFKDELVEWFHQGERKEDFKKLYNNYLLECKDTNASNSTISQLIFQQTILN